MPSNKRSKKGPLPKKGVGALSSQKKEEKAGAKASSAALPSSPAVAGVPYPAYFLLGSMALTVAGLFSFPNYHINLDPQGLLARLLVHPWILWVGVAGLVWSFRKLPEAPDLPEISRLKAYLWFAVFFGLCAFTRFYKPGEPVPDYWSDFMVAARDIRGILDFHDFFIIFPTAAREPFFPYFTAALWEIFPHATGVWIERLSSTLIDLAAVWVFYLLGRTLHGRRMGLILAAFWSLSLPMTFWSYTQAGTNSTVLACGLALLFFFRLIQKPTFARFIYWALSLGFGAVSYVPFRPWTPILITAVLLWILMGSAQRPKEKAPWVLALGLWFSWVFLFVYRNNFLSRDNNHLVNFLLHPWIVLGVFAVLIYTLFKTWEASKKEEVSRRLFGWAAGCLLAGLLSAPMMFNGLYAAHTSESSLFHVDGRMGLLTQDSLQLLWSQITYCWGMMFTLARFGLDPYPFAGHNYFDVFSELAMVLGLAYVIARPSWGKALIVSLVGVGMVPFVLSQIQHAGRVSGAVAPLFLIGGWGLDYFWRLFSRETKKASFRKVVFLLFLALWAWDGYRSFTLCRQWMAVKDNDVLIGEQIAKDWKENRVLIARYGTGDQFATSALTMLCDQEEAYLLNDPNPLYVEEGEKGKDVVLLMYVNDKVLADRVKKDFPQAQWTRIPGMNPKIPVFMNRVLIPFDGLTENKNKLIYVQKVPHSYWRRRFYCQEYGVARGLMWWDERVPSLSAPIPPHLANDMTAKAEGEFNVPAAGDYVFSAGETTNVVDLSIDGRQVLELRPRNGTSLHGRTKMHLEAGPHQATLNVDFRSFSYFPDIEVTPPGGGTNWLLGKTL